MSKKSRLSPNFRANASKPHMSVGHMLQSSSLTNTLRVYQEYPVNRVSPYYDNGRHHYDWVILDWQCVIEVHGEQHRQPCTFGGMTEEEALQRFKEQQIRDLKKKRAAIDAGWIYVVFWHDEEITLSSLLDKIEQFKKEYPPSEETIDKPPAPKTKARDPYKQKQLDRAREYRKRKYREMKAKRRNK